MFKFTCLALCAVAVNLSSVYANKDGPANMEDVIDIMLECAKEHGVKVAEIRAVTRTKDVTNVNPCLWSCALKKTGFFDDKGQYVLNPGLTFIRNIVKDDEAYTNLENIAKSCESVNDKEVTDGKAGCERGAMVADCFLEQFKLVEQKASSSNR